MATTYTAGDEDSSRTGEAPPIGRVCCAMCLPYSAPFVGSVVLLMALVGLLDAFRVLLIGPIFDRVLNPGSQGKNAAVV